MFQGWKLFYKTHPEYNSPEYSNYEMFAELRSLAAAGYTPAIKVDTQCSPYIVTLEFSTKEGFKIQINKFGAIFIAVFQSALSSFISSGEGADWCIDSKIADGLVDRENRCIGKRNVFLTKIASSPSGMCRNCVCRLLFRP